MSHENRETIEHGTTGEPLAPSAPYERPSYATLPEAEAAAKLRFENTDPPMPSQNVASSQRQDADQGERLTDRALRRAFKGPCCTTTTKTGQPCRAGATASSGHRFCFNHDPEVSPQVKLAAVQRGGLIATRQYALPDAPDPDLATPDAIERAIKETAGRVTRGELAPSVALALTGLYNAALRAYEMNIARRVAELEQLAASRAKPIQGSVTDPPRRMSGRIIYDGQERS